MRKKRNIIFLSILFLAIGFAAVTTTLVINGTLVIGSNQNDFDNNVIFTRANTEEEGLANISLDGKVITFKSKELSNISETSVLDFDVTNKSRQYGATATLECLKTDENNPYNDYLDLSIEPQNFDLNISETQSGKLTVTMIKSFVGSNESNTAEIEIKCTIVASALEVAIENENNPPENEIPNPITNNLIDYITELEKTNSEELAYDETIDNNLRYIGANPNNYVEFNDELWRIIGVMNNIEDIAGNKASHIKIIRAESIGSYSWDNKKSGTGSSNSIDGSNDWQDSTLQLVLNSGAYFNRTAGTCPSNRNGVFTTCDFSENGLTTTSKSMISNIKWNLGEYSTTEIPASSFYEAERKNEVYTGHVATWTGYVGLMYPSDYGFAVGSSTRESCLNKNLKNYGDSECYKNDWLFVSDIYQWTLTPCLIDSSTVFNIHQVGTLNFSTTYVSRAIRPTVYLNASVKIASGTGTSDDPYILKI